VLRPAGQPTRPGGRRPAAVAVAARTVAVAARTIAAASATARAGAAVAGGGGEDVHVPEVDVAIVGAGAAGLSLAWELAGDAPRAPTAALVEPAGPAGGGARSPVRTWCSWGPPGGPFEPAVSARWDRVAVVGPDGIRQAVDLAPLAYSMVRSPDLEALVAARVDASPRVRRLAATVRRVDDAPEGALVLCDGPGGPVGVSARWAYDSRPRLPRGGRTALLQHFRGWFVRAPRDAFDPDEAVLMDFRTAQPARGVSFGYVLPTSRREALVEYTEFSRQVLDDAGYDRALRAYAEDLLGLRGLDVVAVEQGAIPMTDGVFDRRAGRHVFRIGTAGGATRPSTGFTFAAAQRQARSVAALLLSGSPDPVPPAVWSRRHLWMDAVVLRALDTGRVDGAAFLAGLFRRHPGDRVLRFLDGGTTLAEDLAVMRSSPLGPMVGSTLDLLVRR